MAQLPKNPFKYGDKLYAIYDGLEKLEAAQTAQDLAAERIAGLADGSKFITCEKIELSLPNVYHLLDAPNGSYYSIFRSERKLPLEQGEKKARDAIAAARQLIESRRPEIEAAQAHNEQLKQKVIALMQRIGIPTSYTTYEFPTARSKTKKTVSHSAGYMGDLERVCPYSPLKSAESMLANYEREFNTWLERAKAEERTNAEKEADRVLKELLFKVADDGRPLAPIFLQFGIDVASFTREPIEPPATTRMNHVLKRISAAVNAAEQKLFENRYLYLAVTMRRIRQDPDSDIEEVENAFHVFKAAASPDDAVVDLGFIDLEIAKFKDAFQRQKAVNGEGFKPLYDRLFKQVETYHPGLLQAHNDIETLRSTISI